MATQPSRARPTPEQLRDLYLKIEFWIEIGDEALPAVEAVHDLGTAVFVLTARDPFIAARSSEELKDESHELSEVLREAGATIWSVVGESAVVDWVGVAATGLSRRRARQIGRQFHQEVIFELTPEEQIVHGCFTTWTRRRPILDSHDAATREAGADLAGAALAVLGIPITAAFARARHRGWTYEGPTGVRCPRCGHTLHLFGNNLRSRGGTPYRAMAIVCAEEAEARLPNDHVAELATLKAWRSYALARRDADHDNLTDQAYWAYVVELDDDVNDKKGEKPWVYVGQSASTPEERFRQHLDGYKASKWVKRHGRGLRADLYQAQPTLRTQAEALAYEAYLAERLSLDGYSIKGGH